MTKKPEFFRSPHALAGADLSEPLLVALSGGADSCCLLYAMQSYAESIGCKLYAAHVNHNIRTDEYGGEAARDEGFCRELCRDLGVELFVASVDVPTLAAQSGESLETAARRVRYEFFASVMQKTGVKILATAHNADDNLETQIFNLCRGCSTDGLCGIPRKRPFPEARGVIVRPILDAPKAEILDFCRENGIQYVTDSTNLEDDCTRNKIRHNVIPELVAIFGNPQRAAMRLANSAADDTDYINSRALEFLQSCGGKLPTDKLAMLHPAVRSRVLEQAFKKQYGVPLESVHLSAIQKLIDSAKPEGAVSLPCRARAVIKQGLLVLEADLRDEPSTAQPYEIALTAGENLIYGTDFAVVISDFGSVVEAPENYEKYAEATLYCHEGAQLSARNRREGDTILNGGMHKKLKKLMCDKKVCPADRAALPLILCDGEIIYAPLCAVSDACRAKKDRQKITASIYKDTERTKP